MNKPTGLAAFTRKGAASAQQTGTDREHGTEQSEKTRRRARGKGDVVALTVRLPRAEWQRVHQLAVAEGVSIQQLIVDGLSKVFAEKGLPTLSV
jgi:predicted DNA binding CopG/RHH family protein